MRKNHRLAGFLSPANQSGAVLVVALLMLLVITALGVGSISMTNMNMQLVQNQQRKQETEQVVENAINYLLSDLDYYVNNSTYVDTGGNFILSFPANVSNSMSVTINKLECLLEAIPAGCSLVVGTSAPCHPEYYWEASVSVIDDTSGASSTVVEGFKFKYLAGYCPI
ncbi:MAG TPA: hypothetical protein DCW94_08075 [Porticoccaceae bacterium]|jgi:hypothetical protein|nr:hypothetical protein [Porticoccaceae bacterium]